MDVITKDVRALAKKELAAANRRFRMFASPHEGYAVIREELDELIDEVRKLHFGLTIRLWRDVKRNEPMKREHLNLIYDVAIHAAVEAIQLAAKDDIEKAVSWWAGKLMDHQPHSNGDDSFTSVAVCFLADTMRQSVTLDQLNTFKAALAKSIEEYAKSIQAFGFSIGSDYGPCKMLADAAAEAGIDRANFPFKTTMFFTEKEGVLVRDGYGAPAVRIC